MTKKLTCRLFGHHYERATSGFTAIDGRPVFRCRCGQEWFPHDWCRTSPTKRDTFDLRLHLAGHLV